MKQTLTKYYGLIERGPEDGFLDVTLDCVVPVVPHCKLGKPIWNTLLITGSRIRRD